MKKLLTLAVMLCVFLQVSADSWTDSNGIVWSFTVSEGKAYRVRPYDKSNITGDLVIPETMNSYPVGSIADDAFYSCNNLTSVNIPNNVTYIGESAFQNCENLATITLPNSLVEIGYRAFYCCEKLESLNLPGSLKAIGEEAFCGCKRLTTLTIPGNVETVGDEAFAGCYDIEELTISEGVKSIEGGAFAGFKITSVNIPKSVTQLPRINPFFYCRSLETITVDADNPSYYSLNNSLIERSTNKLVAASINTVIPNGIKIIGNSAFYGLPIETITIPNTVTTIGNSAFSNCEELVSITIPGSVTEIDNYAFSYCHKIESIMLSSGLKTIGQGAFETNSNSLTSMIIPEGVTSIGSAAFQECYALKFVSLPSSLTGMLYTTFYGCNNLSEVEVNTTSPLIVNEYSFPNRTNATLYVPAGSKAAYQAAEYWRDFENINEVGYIGDVNSELTGETGIACFVVNRTGKLGDYYVQAGRPEKVKIIGEVDANDLRSLFYDDYYNTYYTNYIDLSEAHINGCKYNGGNYPDNYLDSSWMGGYSDESWYGPRTLVLPMTLQELKGGADQLYSEQTTPFKTTIYSGKFYVPSGTRNKWIEQTTYPENVLIMDGPSKNVNVSTAGQLWSKLNSNEIETLNELTISGYINAKDFNTLKRMKNLVLLKINATWEAYEGNDGPVKDQTFYRAAEIPAYVFQNHSNLEIVSLRISSGMEGFLIGDYAFDGCTKLKTFECEGVSSLGDFCFRNTKVMDIRLIGTKYDVYWESTYGETNTKYCREFEHIGLQPFFGVESTSSPWRYASFSSEWEDPASDSYDDNYYYLYNLKNFTVIPSYWELYDSYFGRPYFSGVTNKAETLLYAMTTIKDYDLTLPASITTLADYAVSGLQIRSINLNSVTAIGDGFLYKCPLLKSITCDNTAYKSIDGVLYTADLKTLVKYPCASTAESLTIPATINQISKWAFEGSQNLKTITIETTTPPTLAGQAFDDFDVADITLYVPAGSKAAYKAAAYWKEFKEIVEMQESPAIEFADAKVKELCVANWDTNKDGVLSEAEAAAVTDLGEVFKGNTEITSFNELQYFTGLETIGKSAFEGSTVTSVKFPSTLTKIDEWAFAGCKQLRDIDFNGCSAGLEVCAFAECDALEHLELPANIHLWGYAVFHNCKGLKSVVVNNSEDEWADGIFGECSSLETAELYSNNLRSTWTFWNCTSLKSVTFRDAYSGNKYYDQNFYNVPADLVFNVPEGTAESYLKNGYVNLSDKSALPLVREEFEAEAERIAAMADKLADGDKTALTNAVTNARSKVNAAEDYPTIFAQIAAIKEAAKAFIATATLPQEFDVTAATVTNPNFDRFVLGWKFDTHTYNKVGFEDSEISNGDISLNKYLKYCVQDGNGGKIYQTLSNLPAGVYRLEADVYTQNDFGEAKGFSLFANNMAVSSNTEIDKPEHFSVKFEVPTAKDVAIGFNVVHYNFTWMAADNFRLIYEGRAAELPQCAELKSSETDRLYLYNVDADKFLSAGHSMNTHALLDEGGLPVSLTQDGETGYWKIYFFEGSSEDQLLFQNYDGGSEVFVDFNSGWDDGNVDTDIARWSITDAGNGTYLIQNKKRVGTNEYLGNIPTRQDLQDWYSGVSYTDLVADASTVDNIHWMLFTKEAYDMMAAKRRLMSTILRMENSGEDDSEELLANARTVYENGSASLHEVIDMTTLLNSQIGMPTADAPVDMTAVIVNPRFENNTTEGWTGATAVGGRSDATSNLAHEFFEKDFNMYQTITGVPNGRYLLKWKGFHRPGNWEATCSDFASGTDNASAVVYANSVEKTMKNLASHKSIVRLDDGDVEYGGNYYPNSMEGTRKYFDAGYYADELEVEVTDNVLTIGVKCAEKGGEHWVIFSDFELFILENATTVNNKLVVNDVQSVPGGSATLPVSLVNNDKIVSFSVDVRLPEGVKPMTDSNGNIIVKKTSRVPMDVLGNVTADGACRFVALTSGGAISGNNGEVFSFVIQPSGSMELGEYDVRISNIKLINEELLRIQPFDATSKLTLRKAATGDVNGDGDVDVLDATIIQYYLLGRSPSVNLEAADVNGDNEVDILDATIIVFRILGRNTGHAAARQLMSLDPL